MTLIKKISDWLLQTTLFCLLGCFAQTSCSAANLHVLLVLSDGSPIYQKFAETFRQDLPADIQTDVLQRAEDFDRQTADLIVTVGVNAADRVAKITTRPLLASMIPSNTYAHLQKLSHAPTSAIYLDQPTDRQANFLRAALPNRTRIGVLHSADWDMSALRMSLARQNETLIDRTLHVSLFSDLEEVLTESDVLLAVPDDAIYNGSTIRNVLLSSYRRGIPLVGFSQAYVRAGALCAIFSTPEQLAAQAAETTASFARSNQLPAAQYPELFSIAINQEVARTLDIFIKSAEAIHLQLEKSSGGTR